MLHIFTTVTQEQDVKTGDIEIIDILKSIELPEENLYLDEECINCPFDVTNFLPTWLVDEHNSENTLFVKFIQHYFDWLYCTDKSNIYMNNIFDLFDTNNITDKTRRTILRSNIPGFDEAVAGASSIYYGETLEEPDKPVAYKVLGRDQNQTRYPGFGWFWPVYTEPPTHLVDEDGNQIPYHVHNIEWDSEASGNSSSYNYPEGAGEAGVYTLYMPSITEVVHAFTDILDFNGDGIIDGADRGQFLVAWGGDDPRCDINGDGIVDDADQVLFNKRLNETFGYPTWYPTINNDQVYAISDTKIKQLLKNIKHNIYQRKTTKESIQYLFETLFGNQVTVGIVESNGNIDISINGSPRFTNDFRNFCKRIYEELLHPIGMSYTLLLNSNPIVLRSQRQDDRDEEDRTNYQYGPVLAGATLTAYEFPLLGNYYVYHSDDVSTIAPVTGCEDSTPPVRGITTNDANMPTFTHPNWYYGVSGGTSFGNINISSMMMIPFEDNPNIGITSCANL